MAHYSCVEHHEDVETSHDGRKLCPPDAAKWYPLLNNPIAPSTGGMSGKLKIQAELRRYEKKSTLPSSTSEEEDGTVQVHDGPEGWDPAWNDELAKLESMGFSELEVNQELLVKFDGDVLRTVTELVKKMRASHMDEMLSNFDFDLDI